MTTPASYCTSSVLTPTDEYGRDNDSRRSYLMWTIQELNDEVLEALYDYLVGGEQAPASVSADDDPWGTNLSGSSCHTNGKTPSGCRAFVASSRSSVSQPL